MINLRSFVNVVKRSSLLSTELLMVKVRRNSHVERTVSCQQDIFRLRKQNGEVKICH